MTEAELDEALTLGGDLIGINNRDLHTFETSLDTTYRLLELIPNGVQVVTEERVQRPRESALLSPTLNTAPPTGSSAAVCANA